jgi:hypothetical protein
MNKCTECGINIGNTEETSGQEEREKVGDGKAKGKKHS